MDEKKDDCTHEKFQAIVAVNRLLDTQTFHADVTISCQDCQLPFRFLGALKGLNMVGITTSVDGTELRTAIAPGPDPNFVGPVYDVCAVPPHVWN